ncbi:methyltransferase [Catenulispora yoronensis]
MSPEPIVQVAAGFMAAKQLFAASATGLFAALAQGGLPLSELAAKAGIAEQSCRILADSMVGLGLMERDGADYRNGAAAAAYLAGDPETLDLRPHMAFWDAISYPHWLGFDKTAREALPNELDLSGDRMTAFFGGVQAYNSAHALMLDQYYDFGAHRRVLDLAGLSGAFLAAAVDRHPELRGTFFADPQMVEFARPGLKPEHLERIELVAGDAAVDKLPEGHDAVLLEHVVHRFDAEANRALLRRAREAVEPGAALLVLDFFLDEGEPRRALDSLLAGEYLTIDGTVVYPEAEVRSWVEETGWRWVETRLLPGSPRVLIAEAV